MRRVGLTQRVDAVPDRHERRDALDQAWTRLLLAADLLPVPLPTGVTPTRLLDLLNLDGVILTGGNDLADLADAKSVAPDRDRFEIDLLRACMARRRPVLGVCRGMQLIVRHFGGTLTRWPGHVATTHALRVSQPNVLPVHDGQVVNSFHEFAVPIGTVGNGLTSMASAPDGCVEAVAHDDLPIFGIMWHPERDSDPTTNKLLLRSLFQEVPTCA